MNTYEYNYRNFPDGQKVDVKTKSSYTKGPIKFVIHGYTGGLNNPRMIQLRNAYRNKNPDLNIIQMDFTQLAEDKCYWTLLKSLGIIGKCAAEFIKNAVNTNEEIKIDDFHVIGFSFGAHAAAVLSDNIRKIGTLKRVTGLDPAFPGFFFPFTFANHKLNRSHAEFVDVIHTNAGIRGVFSSNAHLDIYGNGGTRQKGCDTLDTLCSHARAMDYFIESVNSNDGFYAVKCGHLDRFLGRCQFKSAKTILVGEPCARPEDKTDEGTYSFKTNPETPYAKGKPSV